MQFFHPASDGENSFSDDERKLVRGSRGMAEYESQRDGVREAEAYGRRDAGGPEGEKSETGR